MIHLITLGNAIQFSVCHFSIMEITLREKWVAGFASVGKQKKYFHPFSTGALLNWSLSLRYGGFNLCTEINISAKD